MCLLSSLQQLALFLESCLWIFADQIDSSQMTFEKRKTCTQHQNGCLQGGRHALPEELDQDADQEPEYDTVWNIKVCSYLMHQHSYCKLTYYSLPTPSFDATS